MASGLAINQDLQILIGQQKTAAKMKKKPSFRSRIISDRCIRVIYMACITMMSGSVIVAVILFQLVMLPYLSESEYEPGWCLYRKSQESLGVKSCQNKCSKETSNFTCLRIQAVYISEVDFRKFSNIKNRAPTRYDLERLLINKNGLQARNLFLYENFGTYAAHKKEQCAKSPCHKREADNRVEVDRFKYLIENNKIMQCFARPYPDYMNYVSNNSTTTRPGIFADAHDHDTVKFDVQGDEQLAAALLYTNYFSETFLHSIIWPFVIFFFSFIVCVLIYLADGCRVWRIDTSILA